MIPLLFQLLSASFFWLLVKMWNGTASILKSCWINMTKNRKSEDLNAGHTAEKAVSNFFWSILHSVCMKSGHAVVFILTCEVYLQFICLRRHCGSALFPFTALAIISHDRIKLYWAAACTSFLLNSVCATAGCLRYCWQQRLQPPGLAVSDCTLLLLWSLLNWVQVRCDVKLCLTLFGQIWPLMCRGLLCLSESADTNSNNTPRCVRGRTVECVNAGS